MIIPKFPLYIVSNTLTGGQNFDAFLVEEDVQAAVEYYGYVGYHGQWIIVKVTISGDTRTTRYLSGRTDFATNWTGRAALTYLYPYQMGA